MVLFGEKYGKTMRQLWEKTMGKLYIWGNYNYGKPILKKTWETHGKNEHVDFLKGPFWDRYGKTMRQLWKKLWQNYMGKLLLWENDREKP